MTASFPHAGIGLERLVATSRVVAATSSRTAKRDAIAALLRDAADDTALVVDHLRAQPRQRRTGVGYRSLGGLPEPAANSTLTVRDVDAALSALEDAHGAGAAAARRAHLTALFARATQAEQEFIRALLVGELRQGALDGVVLEAIATAAQAPPALVRRAAMLCGSLSRVAHIALSEGTGALYAVVPQVGTALQPMLASSAPTIADAMASVRDDDAAAVVVDAKIDGVRAQIHKLGDRVAVFSRTLDDMTARLGRIVAVVHTLPTDDAILDGEIVALDNSGRPRPFQDVGSQVAAGGQAGLTLLVFDALRIDGVTLIDRPLTERLDELARVAPHNMVMRTVTADPSTAQRFFDDVVAAGFEGVVIKRGDAPYAAGRRGGDWVKVKPVRTVDLVVVGVEWGSGRRTGTLSNIHLGARDEATGEFVMVGKTFKGMTDAMLAWQTRRFLNLESGRDGHVVWTRPEQVVEIAFDAVQRSRRYPGGVALRFARVLRYRDDKRPDEADSIQSLQALSPPSDGACQA